MTNDDQNSGQYTGGFTVGDEQGTPPPAQPVQPAPASTVPAAPIAPMPGTSGPPKPPKPPTPPVDPALANYIFASKMKDFTTTITLPENSLSFDEAKFINLLAGSISLSRDEKKKIIDSIPKLKQAQVDELIRIFDEERAKFIELSQKHAPQLKKLEDQHLADWKDLELQYKAAVRAEEDQGKAEEIRKQLGL